MVGDNNDSPHNTSKKNIKYYKFSSAIMSISAKA
jgi:hypothetical protein